MKRVLEDYGIVKMRLTERAAELKKRGLVKNGLTDSQISNFLNGIRDPSVSTWETIERSLHDIEPAALQDLLNRRRMRYD